MAKIRRLFLKLEAYIKEHKIASGVIAVLLLIFVFYGYKNLFGNSGGTQYVVMAVGRGTITSTVTGTGQISGLNQLEIKPQGSGGTVTQVKVKNGDKVKAGQVLAVIDERSALVSLSQSKASLLGAQASYDKLISGPTTQDLSALVAAVQNSQDNLTRKLNDSYYQVENAISSNIDNLFQNADSFSPKFNVVFYDSSTGSNFSLNLDNRELQYKLEYERAHASDIMKSWKAALSGADVKNNPQAVKQSEDYARQILSFLNDMVNAMNSLRADGTKYSSSLTSAQNGTVSARNAVNTVLDDIYSSEQTLESNQLALDQKKTPATNDDIKTSAAQLAAARASYQEALNNYDNNIIKAPFDGTVGQLNVNVGDIVNSSTIAAVLATDQKIVNVPLNEVDAAKVKVGDKATLTFDALPYLKDSGTVTSMDSVGTVTQGVVTYNVEISLDSQDESIKPGMSVSASITTDEKQDVLVVPSSAVKTVGGASVVSVLNSPVVASGSKRPSTVNTAVSHSVRVQTGVSDDTQTEIVSGLNEGDNIVVRAINGSQTSTAARTQTAGGLFGGGGGGGGGNFRRLGN